MGTYLGLLYSSSQYLAQVPGTCSCSVHTYWIGLNYYSLLGWSEVKLLSRVRLFATPWTVAYEAPLSIEFSRQEYWSGLPYPPPRDLPDPGIKPRSPALQADALPSEPPGKPLLGWMVIKNKKEMKDIRQFTHITHLKVCMIKTLGWCAKKLWINVCYKCN